MLPATAPYDRQSPVGERKGNNPSFISGTSRGFVSILYVKWYQRVPTPAVTVSPSRICDERVTALLDCCATRWGDSGASCGVFARQSMIIVGYLAWATCVHFVPTWMYSFVIGLATRHHRGIISVSHSFFALHFCTSSIPCASPDQC